MKPPKVPRPWDDWCKATELHIVANVSWSDSHRHVLGMAKYKLEGLSMRDRRASKEEG